MRPIIYVIAQSLEPQAVAGRWRAMTRAHVKHLRGEIECQTLACDELTIHLTNVFLACGVTGVNRECWERCGPRSRTDSEESSVLRSTSNALPENASYPWISSPSCIGAATSSNLSTWTTNGQTRNILPTRGIRSLSSVPHNLDWFARKGILLPSIEWVEEWRRAPRFC